LSIAKVPAAHRRGSPGADRGLRSRLVVILENRR